MIIELTHALGLSVVAEGIERPDQLAELRALGCGHGQGFLFARPVAFDDLVPLMGAPFGSKSAA